MPILKEHQGYRCGYFSPLYKDCPYTEVKNIREEGRGALGVDFSELLNC
jgi:hypothetical protein